MPAAEREELEGMLRKVGIGGGGGGPLDVAAEFGTGRRPDTWFSGKLLVTEGCDAELTDKPASRSGRSMADGQYEECAAQVRTWGGALVEKSIEGGPLEFYDDMAMLEG
jgi:hypothetical protein